jgi:hypothetical protein
MDQIQRIRLNIIKINHLIILNWSKLWVNISNIAKLRFWKF